MLSNESLPARRIGGGVVKLNSRGSVQALQELGKHGILYMVMINQLSKTGGIDTQAIRSPRVDRAEQSG